MRHAEHVMGTVVSIELADSHPAPVLTEMIAGVCAWLHEVDARFSTYKPDSEVNPSVIELVQLDEHRADGPRRRADIRSVSPDSHNYR